MKEEAIFLGREIAQHRDYSESTAQAIDDEVKSIVMAGYKTASEILEKDGEALNRIAEALLEREVLDAEEIAALVRGEPLAAKPLPPEPEEVEPEEPAAAPETDQEQEDESPGVLPTPDNQPA